MTADWNSTPALREPDNPLWRYALAAWKIPDVERNCLALQGRGWSVTRILTAAWLARQGHGFGDEATTVQQWREQFTATLRGLRQQISKQQPALNQLRDRLASAELEAERIELALVYESLRPVLHERRGAPTGTLLQDNLRAAAPAPNIDPETVALVDALALHLPTDSLNGAHGP